MILKNLNVPKNLTNNKRKAIITAYKEFLGACNGSRGKYVQYVSISGDFFSCSHWRGIWGKGIWDGL